MEKKLILHIGMWKTGTTYVQSSLYQNRKLLHEHGINYPSEQENHIFILPLVMQRYSDHVAIRSYKPGVEKLKLLSDTYFENIKNNKDNTYFLSSEFFFDLNEGEINKLKVILLDYFDDIQVICYVRSPISHFISSVNEQVKQGHYTLDTAYKKHCKVNEYERIDWWQDVFGSKKVIIRPFDKKQWVEENLIDDFFNSSGLKKPFGFSKIKPNNESLTQAGIEIANEIAKKYSSFDKSRPNTEFLYKIKGSKFSITKELLFKCQLENSEKIKDLESRFRIKLQDNIEDFVSRKDFNNDDTLESIASILLNMKMANHKLYLEREYYKGKFHYLNGNNEKARISLENALELSQFEVYRDLVCVLYDMGLYTELKPHLNKALEIKPEAPWLNKIKNDLLI